MEQALLQLSDSGCPARQLRGSEERVKRGPTYFKELHRNHSKNELQEVGDQHNIAYGFQSNENTSNNGLWLVRRRVWFEVVRSGHYG